MKHFTPKDSEFAKHIVANERYLTIQKVYAIGGDGWSYDIDFAGIDHIMHSSANVKVLILNNNCFANTGG